MRSKLNEFLTVNPDKFKVINFYSFLKLEFENNLTIIRKLKKKFT